MPLMHAEAFPACDSRSEDVSQVGTTGLNRSTELRPFLGLLPYVAIAFSRVCVSEVDTKHFLVVLFLVVGFFPSRETDASCSKAPVCFKYLSFLLRQLTLILGQRSHREVPEKPFGCSSKAFVPRAPCETEAKPDRGGPVGALRRVTGPAWSFHPRCTGVRLHGTRFPVSSAVRTARGATSHCSS